MEELVAAIIKETGLKCAYYPHIGIMEIFDYQGHLSFVDLSSVPPDCSFEDFQLEYFEDNYNLPVIMYNGKKLIYDSNKALSNSATYYLLDDYYYVGTLYENKILYYADAVVYEKNEDNGNITYYDKSYNEIKYNDSQYMSPPCVASMRLINHALTLTRLTLIEQVIRIPGRFIYNGNHTLRREKDDEIFIVAQKQGSANIFYLLSKTEVIEFDADDFVIEDIWVNHLTSRECRYGNHIYFIKDNVMFEYDPFIVDGHMCVYTQEYGYVELLSRSVNPPKQTKAAR